MNAEKIIEELKSGNQRFVTQQPRQRSKKPKDLAKGQSPHTIVLTCADSRVPPELLFDQDLGELFVIRIAGNTASDEAIGSIEYAAANLGSRVCIVLGHTSCGAVAATIDYLKTGEELPTMGLKKVVDPIVESAKVANNDLDRAIDLNVENALEELLEKSPILKDLSQSKKLELIGAKYHLDSGEVQFFRS